MTIIVNDVLKQVQDFLLLLTQKERFVVERRFNLDNKEKATLEEIGQHFSVTRERIRQIEKNALTKLRRNLENCRLIDISDQAFQLIEEAGGVMREDALISKLITNQQDIGIETLQLILTIDKRFQRLPNTVLFYPYLKLANISQDDVETLCKQGYGHLSKLKETLSLDQLYKAVVQDKQLSIDKTLFASLIQIDKKIKLINNDLIGLFEWRHINPRTLRDKIYFVLRSSMAPMHFVNIANQIIEYQFDKKKINLQAVHNELIRHNDFILIGRGIYGLSEWGFKSGTVAEVITSILKNKDSMSQDEIISEVLKQRKVKPITVVLSLKNKENFVRIGRKQYALKDISKD